MTYTSNTIQKLMTVKDIPFLVEIVKTMKNKVNLRRIKKKDINHLQ